jgi:tetratricopeptide (TPR) repeat protein
VDRVQQQLDSHLKSAIANSRAARYQEALADFNQALKLEPGSAMALNNLSWFLATCPDPQFRDINQALDLAERAVELAPQGCENWNTLGVAQYRAGKWAAAVVALEKSGELRKGGDSFDWFFLAMAEWQHGNKDEARRWHDKAVGWTEKNQPQNEELQRFRAEAEELLK